MIVQCPSCASRYRIRDANIPPSGGKIRCPSCSHAFIVYPEASDDEDRTNITSKGEISNLINKMAGGPDQASLAAQDEDYVSTQISTTEQARAATAMANELGDPMDMDGTVEIQNPMKVWKQAQDAMHAGQQQQQQQQPPPPDDDDDEWDDFAATEVVDPAALAFSFDQQQQQQASLQDAVMAPTAEVSREELADAFGVRATSGMQAVLPPEQGGPTAESPAMTPEMQQYHQQYNAAPGDQYGSGQYAPNTPPGGRSTHESWDQAPQQGSTNPHEQVNAFAHPAEQQQHSAQQQQQQWQGDQSGFQERSPSGLTSAALFDNPIPEDDPVNSNINMPSPFDAPSQTGAPQQHQQPAQAPGGDGHPGPWKLKTNFGLTYEFPDTKGLRSWLSSREELEGFTVSADDGASFHALSAFAHLLPTRTASSSGVAQMPSHGSGSFDRPPPQQFGWGPAGSDPSQGNPQGSGLHQASEGQIKGPRINNEYRPPSRESKGRGLLWLVFVILLGAAIVIALETTGVFKVTDFAREMGVLPSEKPEGVAPVVDPPSSGQEDEPEVDPAELAKKQAAEVAILLEDTQRLVDGNKLPTALERLHKLEQLAPQNPLVFDLRAQVLDKLGKAEEAEAARTTAEQLRGGAPAPDAGMVEPTEETE